MAWLPPSRHPLHCGIRLPDFRTRNDSPLRRSCHHALPAICLTRRLPAQRIRRCGLNATFRTRLQRCDGDWWPLSPRRSRVAHAALLATASDGRAYRGKTEVSIKDIRRDALVGALDADQTESLVEALTRSGWLRREAAKPFAVSAVSAAHKRGLTWHHETSGHNLRVDVSGPTPSGSETRLPRYTPSARYGSATGVPSPTHWQAINDSERAAQGGRARSACCGKDCR